MPIAIEAHQWFGTHMLQRMRMLMLPLMLP
jgi:hypothetical protein